MKIFTLLLFHKGNIVTLPAVPFNVPVAMVFPNWDTESEIQFTELLTKAVLSMFDITIKNLRPPFFETHSNGVVTYYIAAAISEDDKNIDLWNKSNNVQLNVRNEGIVVEMMPLGLYVSRLEEIDKSRRNELIAIEVATTLFGEQLNGR